MTRSASPPPIAYSITGACNASTLGRTSIYQLISEGKLETRKVGRRTLIPAAALEAFLMGRGQ